MNSKASHEFYAHDVNAVTPSHNRSWRSLTAQSSYNPFFDWEINTGYQLLYAYDTEISRRFEDEDIYANDINGVSY